MTTVEAERLAMLSSGPLVSLDYLRDYYGLEWPLSDEAAVAFEKFTTSRRKQIDKTAANVSRIAIEGFMSRNGILTKSWMAARLGMDRESFDAVVTGSDKLGIQPKRYLIGNAFVAESFLEDLRSHLKRMRFVTFADHTHFCVRLHAELTRELGSEPTKLFCATSQELGEYPLEIAEYFDCITLKPLSGKHSAWLDFGKPLYLAPDRCSKLFFVRFRQELMPYLAGKAEPANLEVYSRAAEGAENGS